MAVTLTGTGITFPDSSFQQRASVVFTNSTSRNTSGTWTVPVGVTNITVALFGGGGGGGGGATYTYQGGDGGNGGSAISQLTVIPGGTVSFTIGAAGAGSTVNGTSGGTSTLTYGATTITCTGGVRGLVASTVSNGADGADGSGDGQFNEYPASVVSSFPLDIANFFQVLNLTQGGTLRPQTQPASALTWSTSNNPRYAPGVGGQGGQGGQGGLGAGNGGAGGVSGALFIIY